ncbi:uncharacterized protein N7459_005814 [Penicillium hispanicum]|uniref:uncharacterized protein n=1 Tax=Penicillium hispanicum TaxID=1080232 RepID=UPI002541008A|nr:uncharacterized protein N7459_005814 [Penicillium hispanicum]KAJ5579829.1 hypothetical protein N7459_005814 [Penicillium hispanicum]
MAFIDTAKDLPALFKQQVLSTPDALALEDGSTVYTYAELDREVDALANRLRLYGVSRDTLVGVLLPRSAHYVIACLAALRAGGAFLVLELAYPAGLLADVIDDARPAVVITHRAEAGRVKAACPVIALDETTEINGYAKDPAPLPAEDDLDRLAFVSYSSGTTGKPKGIANPHRAPVLSYNLRFAVQDVQPGDRVACNVFFIWEMLRPLLRGATVVTVPDEVSYDPAALVDLLASKRITETLMTPTLLATILARYHGPDIKARLPDLRTLWLNGEVVTTDLARRAIDALPQTRFLNCYSACETHEIACGDIREMIDDSLYCPVGPPLDPSHNYILDERGQQVDVGVAGELFIGGDLLAREYLNLPEATAKAFTPDKFDAIPGARMYRTGDLARKLPSGLLEITGRVGAMIKLRGYSVVPAKVESDICQYLAVSNCIVIAHGDGLERQLVAYVVADTEAGDRPAVEVNESGHSPAARRVLEAHLAHYMIPALWVVLEKLPTNEVSGKVDLKSLPPPRSASPNGNGKPLDKDPIGINDIAAIWANVLKTSKALLKPEDNFFDLGGHSLSLADLASRLSRHFGFRVPIPSLADNTTLAGHLATVRAVRDGHTAAVQADLPAVLLADSTLDADIKPPPNTTMTSITKADTVLLTGVTGFLGAFLLNDLLENTSARIICLIRFSEPESDDQAGGVARIRRNLLDFGLWRDTIMERVEVLPGNLSMPQFGLSSDAFDDLASRVQVIVHAAATVNLVYPYAALRKANVNGTREILRLASKGGATVQYVSTNGVLPPYPLGTRGWSEDAMLDIEYVPTNLLDGYGQTKWVAEQLVLKASERGLPVKIHRCGTISGHSTTGSANAWDLLTALLVESIRLGYAPDVKGWRAEMTPVDFVSQSIVHLATHVGSEADQTVYHLGDPDPIDTRSVFKYLKELGYPTELLPWDEWVALWQEKRGSTKGGDGAFTVDILRSGMPTVEFLRGIVVLDNAKTRPFRAAVERPKVDGLLLETYARHWFARGWLDRPPSRRLALNRSSTTKPTSRGPLSGKVAVVTGASSGIGAAVAAALASQGCAVALGARRLDAMQPVKRTVESLGVKCIARSTDVTSKTQTEALVQAANEELGEVDILVACAGVMYFTMMANTQTEEWERTVDVNCKGLLNALSSTVPAMLARGRGHVVAISSDAGRKVFPGLGVYSASKFFVEATLQALRLETAGTGLRVTAIQPGNTSTPLLNMSTDTEAVKKYGEPSGAKILDPSDVANSIVHALVQPEYVSVNEILVEPRDEPI